jgi:hypothetical protein
MLKLVSGNITILSLFPCKHSLESIIAFVTNQHYISQLGFTVYYEGIQIFSFINSEV